MSDIKEKKVINKKGHIYSEILNNWKIIIGDSLFKVCYPKSLKNSNKFSVSTLLIMVKRGHEVDLEYSKKNILGMMPHPERMVDDIISNKDLSLIHISEPTRPY